MKYISCRKCKGTRYITIDDEVKMCNCYKQYLNVKQTEIDLKKANIDPSFVDYDIDSYLGTKSAHNLSHIKKYIAEFDTKYKGICLYLYSQQNGTQKTTIAKYVGRELLKKKKTLGFITMGELLKTLSNQEFSEDDADTVIKLINKDLLIVDDCFDVKKATVYKSGYQFSFLDTFLRKRLETLKKSIIFTSNIVMENIGENFPDSIMNLVIRNSYQMEFLDVYDRKSFDVNGLFN